jgi:demethylmenaquinone methyltransferase/2-methoxy-6-polyprenyl-1,4-benzoquinol methylase
VLKKAVQNIFAAIPETYELINHILTFRQDIRWREKAARKAAPEGGSLWLDVCTGTGEMGRALSWYGRENALILSLDFSEPMLARARAFSPASNILFVLGDAGILPYPEGTFDGIVISFATRNIHGSRQGLIGYYREFHRVLKRGGLFFNLETSQPRRPVVRAVFHLYIRLAVKKVGSLISGNRAAYAYLSRTIPRFYPPEELSLILSESGFSSVVFETFLFGACALHIAAKGR